MSTIIVIPSRYGSTRLPAKPLKDIAGTSLVERVYNIAKAVQNVDDVFVATDDTRIADHVNHFGGNAIMTPVECKNGTERACALAQKLTPKPDIIINLQGDAVLTPPWIVQALVDTMQHDNSIKIATPTVKLTKQKYEKLLESKANGEVGGTTVTFDKDHNAMYFSKRIIPLLRDSYEHPPVYRHIGMYAYRYDALEHFLSLPESTFEKAEKIEVLRALENGMKVKIVEVDYQGRTHWAIDSQQDVEIVENIIANEGELL